MAQMGEIQHIGEVNDVKGVMNYVYQLEEQIRYVLANLGSDNLAPGSVDLAQLGPNVTKQFTTIINGVDDLETYTRKKVSTIQDEFGNYSTTMQTEEFVGAYVTNALGDYSTTQQTAQQISTYVTNALGDYSTTRETADEIALYVGNHAYQIQSGIDIDASGVDITGSKYVKIRSGGSFILDSDNIDIDSTSGIIEASYNGTPYLRVAAGRTQLLSLDLYSSYDSAYMDVTNTITNLNYYGWIRDASVSGNTLTLTKWSGNTVTFSASGGGYTPSYAMQQLENVLTDVTLNSTTGALTLYLVGNYSIKLLPGTHNAD